MYAHRATPRSTHHSFGALLATGSLVLLSLAGVPASNALGQPFDPDQALVLIAQAEPAPACPSGTGTQLFEGVQIEDADENVTVQYHEVGPVSCVQYNSIGFDAVDGYVYGVATNNYGGVVVNEVVRIDADGGVTGTGVVLPVSDSGRPYNMGVYVPTSSTTGEMVVAAGCGVGTGEYYTIALSGGGAGSPDTVGVAVRHALTVGANLPPGNPIMPNLADWVFLDGYLWGFSTNTANTPSGLFLYRLDPVTGELSRTPLPAGFSGLGTSSFGGQWLYGNGNIGLSDNVTGMIYQVRLVGADGKAYAGGAAMPSVQFVGQPIQGMSTVTGLIMKSSGNDATSSPGLPVDLSLTKQVSVGGSASAHAGEFSISAVPAGVVYTLVVTNESLNNTSSGWLLEDPLPVGLTITGYMVDSSAAHSTASCAITSAAVTCVGSQGLRPGESIAITLTGTASGDAPIDNLATVIGNDLDPDPDNDTDEATLTPKDDREPHGGSSEPPDPDPSDPPPPVDDPNPPTAPPTAAPTAAPVVVLARTGGSVMVPQDATGGLTSIAALLLLAGGALWRAVPTRSRLK